AIAILDRFGSASTIEVLPAPGHRSKVKTWHVPQMQASNVVSLSWAPDGRRLSYIAGFQTAGGLAGGLETLDATAPGSVASGLSPWSPASKAGLHLPACMPDAVAWLGGSGRLAALEECGNSMTGHGREILVPVSPRTGEATGPALVIA